MSKIHISPNALGTGSVTIASPNTNSDYEITLPEVAGELLATVAGALIGGITEAVVVLTGATPLIDASLGGVQTWTTSGNSTPTYSIPSGSSVLLAVTLGGAHTITWTGVTWLYATVPKLSSGQTHFITLFNVGAGVYGSWGGRL